MQGEAFRGERRVLFERETKDLAVQEINAVFSAVKPILEQLRLDSLHDEERQALENLQSLLENSRWEILGDVNDEFKSRVNNFNNDLTAAAMSLHVLLHRKSSNKEDVEKRSKEVLLRVERLSTY